MDNSLESLLVSIINLFADKFGKKAILRGGMVLRLLDSARLTNDLDYLLIPFESKNEVVDEVVKTLNLLEGVRVEHSLNSQCLRCLVTKGSVVAQVEVKVDIDCKVNVISTASLAKIHNQTSRLINVLSYDVALANKLAAWYERRLYRDIYDIYLLLNMGVKADLQILATRLEKPRFAKNISEMKKKCTVEDFYTFLRVKIENIDIDTMTKELISIMPQEELLGLEMKLKNVILRSI